MNKKLFNLFLALLFFVIFSCSKQGPVKKLNSGDKAPGFTLKNQIQLNVALSDFKGEKNVILIFYPLDFTPL